MDLFPKKRFGPYFGIFYLKTLISPLEDMKIKKNTFSTLVLELFFPSIANCRKLKKKKSTSPSAEGGGCSPATVHCSHSAD
jgi:hypothetical protein